VHRLRGDEATSEHVLRASLRDRASKRRTLSRAGLSLVRQHRALEALRELGRGSNLDPSAARYAYVYAVAFLERGHQAESIEVLEGAAKRALDDLVVLVPLTG
jgi:hypothetical protein